MAGRLGEALLTIGHFEDAFAAFASARSVAPDPATGLRYATRQAVCRNRQGRYAAALGMLTRIIDRCTSDDAIVEATCRDGRASIYHQTARHRQCWDEALVSLELAERGNDEATQAHALQMLYNSGSVLGEPGTEAYGQRALRLFRSLGSTMGEAEMLNNMGVSAYYEARWRDAEDLYRQSLDGKTRAGDLVGAAVVRMNIAELHLERGVPADAGALLDDALRNFDAAGFALGIAYVHALLGRLAALEGQFDRAVTELELGIEGFDLLHASGHAADARLQLALALLMAGRVEESRGQRGTIAGQMRREPELFDVPGRAAAQLKLMDGAERVLLGEGDAIECWIEARECAVEASAGELVATCDLLLGDDGDAAAELERRGIRRVPILDLAGGRIPS